MHFAIMFCRLSDYKMVMMRPIGDILSDGGTAGNLSPFELKLTQTHQSLKIKDQVHFKQSG